MRLCIVNVKEPAELTLKIPHCEGSGFVIKAIGSG